MIQCVLWDWNGTLLDDAQYACEVVNHVLQKHQKPKLESVETYREIFCFPVSIFYERLGLGGDVYDQAAHDWVDEYYAHEEDCVLRKGVKETVRALHEMGVRQAVVSATPKPALNRQVGRYPEILPYFDELVGIDDIYATSKVRQAQDFMAREKIDEKKTLFIGDSLHDAEVAQAIGCRCVLLLGGHQTEKIVRSAGCPVLKSAWEIPEYVRSLSNQK